MNDRNRMEVGAMFALGAFAIFLMGIFTSLAAQMLALRVTADTPRIATLRLQYIFVGFLVFLALAAAHHWAARRRPPELGGLGQASFWLMFLGYNAAFFPTALRRLPLLPSEIPMLFAVNTGPEVWLGLLAFASGILLSLWDLAVPSGRVHT